MATRKRAHIPSRDDALVDNALRRSPLFATWPADAFIELERMAGIERYRQGDSIHHIGEKVRGLYVVVTGSLEGFSRDEATEDSVMRAATGQAAGVAS